MTGFVQMGHILYCFYSNHKQNERSMFVFSDQFQPFYDNPGGGGGNDPLCFPMHIVQTEPSMHVRRSRLRKNYHPAWAAQCCPVASIAACVTHMLAAH